MLIMDSVGLFRALIIAALADSFALAATPINDRPIIGILAQEYYGNFHHTQPGNASYIAASYVKYLEAAGARVVPIMINKPRDYYETLFNSINGVLFPGGGADLGSSGYGKAGKILFDLAVKANDRGDYFPIWGTCLGFELLCFLAGNSTNAMQLCSAHDLALPLNLLPGYNESRIFRNAPTSLLDHVQTKSVTINYHQWCLTPKRFSDKKLDKFFRVLSHNQDKMGVPFVSLVEGIRYPFYAIASHPEKNLFEFVYRKGHLNTPHFPEAISVSQYFANFFVNEARKNAHHFQDQQSEESYLIYNFSPEYTGKTNSSFEQTYFFSLK